LDIKDLEKFNRALWLERLWHQCDENEKPWKNLIKVTAHKDKHPFFQSIIIQIGNEKNTLF
jgi:hypothetical protein